MLLRYVGTERQGEVNLAGGDVLERDAERAHRCLPSEARANALFEVGIFWLESQ